LKSHAIPTITATDMRAINRSAILELVRSSSPISRSEIAARLNVSLPTVMRIVDELVAEDLVRPTGVKEWSGGRKRSLVEFNGSSHLVIGLDLGGTKLYGAVADLNGNILHEAHITHHQTQSEESFQMLCTFIDDLLSFAQGTGLTVSGIGLGVPGVVNDISGLVELAPSLDWIGFPLKQRLIDRYKALSIVVENDVNLAAVGELWFGPESDVENLVLITIGTGIGAGVVINGMVFPGSHFMAGEIGYLLPDRTHLDHDYPGFGAFEQLASGTGIAARARQALCGKLPQAELDALTAEDVFAAARRGEEWSQPILQETIDYLAVAIASICQVLDPDLILLGGGVSRSADLLIEPILERLRGSIPVLPRLESSRLGYRAAVMGSIIQLLRITTKFYWLNKFS
jgi:predicted NBD/HSP70 family sugar kinase